MIKKIENRGGKRPNSGRKKLENKIKFKVINIKSDDFLIFSSICKKNKMSKSAMFTRFLEHYSTLFEKST